MEDIKKAYKYGIGFCLGAMSVYVVAIIVFTLVLTLFNLL